MKKFLGLIALGLLAGPLAANAAIVSGTYNFSVSGFTAGAPIDPISGSFSITFDNAAAIADTTVGFSMLSSNFFAPASGYTYSTTNDRLVVGGLLGGVLTGTAGTDDWLLAITNFSTAPTVLTANYSKPGLNATYFSNTGVVQKVPVPEPGTLALLGLGLAGLGIARRKRVA